jgi:hypothetical protein
VPSIWQKELPNCNFAMSFRPGSSDQPDCVATVCASIVAPQAGQLSRAPSLTRPHQGQVCVDISRPLECGDSSPLYLRCDLSQHPFEYPAKENAGGKTPHEKAATSRRTPN